MQKTFIMVKPDGVQRNLIGHVIQRFERKGFQMIAGKLMVVSDELAKEHYKEHEGKSFFGDLMGFITSGPVFAMVWEGTNVIDGARHIIGATNPLEATPGTIRGDFGIVTHRNLVHGSDSEESSKREIGLFFAPEQLVTYQKAVNEWLD
ncbi:nucleoside-diphosphate kinase [Aureibacillus halotolerans]|uniref:Nucleoside diphosphate kinase n=1 Tax=Aureibacillus halotolerans TaxID=1508390 RepID=A0A4R6U778_9BACI|nr:nucleoside-diphosphate kinase [Aureibacillus halotolerans]TDQ41532.1 nucleoside diphosphate kinase [Aureibacillus halotolerans]